MADNEDGSKHNGEEMDDGKKIILILIVIIFSK